MQSGSHSTITKLDAAVPTDVNSRGLGMIARYEEGTVFLEASRSDWGRGNVEEAEIRAVKMAVDLAQQGWKRIVFEDAMLVPFEVHIFFFSVPNFIFDFSYVFFNNYF